MRLGIAPIDPSVDPSPLRVISPGSTGVAHRAASGAAFPAIEWILEETMTSDAKVLSDRQAQRLAELAGIDPQTIVGSSLIEIRDRLPIEIDPEILFGRRICGRVVKRDPVTGDLLPVPYATVHVEDTDCSFYAYYPPDWWWGWFFPFNCRREEIATVKTDRCGNFCVWVPRFEIDWILRWRSQIHCWPWIFARPSIWDLIQIIDQQPPFKWPIPIPDPPPIDFLKDGGLALHRAEELIGRPAVDRLLALNDLGGDLRKPGELTNLLHSPAFSESRPAPPPITEKLRELLDRGDKRELAAQLDLRPELFEQFEFKDWLGPFLRCWEIIVPEWTSYLDVPDITFRVTQDVDGDGVEDLIYSESYFNVRWDAGYIPPVTLEANALAQTGICGRPPETEPCAEIPEIQFIGTMPIRDPAVGDPYHAGGYAKRVNRPWPPAPPRPLAETPYAGGFGLFGCIQIEGAEYYRLHCSYNGGAKTIFTQPPWYVYRVKESVTYSKLIQPDPNGWYEILNDPTEKWEDDDMFIYWQSNLPGEYVIDVELADGAHTPLGIVSAPVTVRIDNTGSTPAFRQLWWNTTGSPTPLDWTELSLTCPVVHRPAGSDIYFKVRFEASALHLRSFQLSGGGCGGGTLNFVSTTIFPNVGAPTSVLYRHVHPTDNSKSGEAVFRMPGANLDGAYSFALQTVSRAFNPSDPTGRTTDFYYDPAVLVNWSQLPIAVVTGP
jgi:hypothetical protein